MLVELWTVPLLALSTGAGGGTGRGSPRWPPPAAALTRELALPVLLLGLVLALHRREDRRPWLVAAAVTAAGLGLHVLLALGVGIDGRHRGAAPAGSGIPPRSVISDAALRLARGARAGALGPGGRRRSCGRGWSRRCRRCWPSRSWASS